MKALLALYSSISTAYPIDNAAISLLRYIQRQYNGISADEAGDNARYLPELVEKNLLYLRPQEYRFYITKNGVKVLTDLDEKLEFSDNY